MKNVQPNTTTEGTPHNVYITESTNVKRNPRSSLHVFALQVHHAVYGGADLPAGVPRPLLVALQLDHDVPQAGWLDGCSKILDCVRWPFGLDGLWLRYAMLHRLSPSFPCIVRHAQLTGAIQRKEGTKFCCELTSGHPDRRDSDFPIPYAWIEQTLPLPGPPGSSRLKRWDRTRRNVP